MINKIVNYNTQSEEIEFKLLLLNISLAEKCKATLLGKKYSLIAKRYKATGYMKKIAANPFVCVCRIDQSCMDSFSPWDLMANKNPFYGLN